MFFLAYLTHSTESFEWVAALVITYELDVSDESGVLYFTTDRDAMNHVVVDRKPANITQVPVTQVAVEPLDNLLADEAPLLIKIDVEGFESRVLAGATVTLAEPNLKAIIIELNRSGTRYGYSDDETHNKLQQLGFSAYEYNPFNRSLTAKRGVGTRNTIYVRDLSFIKERVESAPAFSVVDARL